jgi:hypothetical protein
LNGTGTHGSHIRSVIDGLLAVLDTPVRMGPDRVMLCNMMFGFLLSTYAS